MNDKASTWRRALIIGPLVAVLPCVLYARDRGVNQPGAVGNGGLAPGLNQPGVAGNRGRHRQPFGERLLNRSTEWTQ